MSIKVYGALVDNQTRCVHYHGVRDIIALQCARCLKFYPCYQCHNEAEDHSFGIWQANQFEQHAILCGNCGETLSISQYLNTDSCPYCRAEFNPNCAKHYDLYFNV